ncbi:sucrase ferredoxin [Streptomyces sp. CMB-StM0423]|uniref:sucrase ferredoxin n=1 Tax=Streptomyces sp. CMB-StM0423 TaxID=2059884 RepID=UPI000C70FFAF|nr:sucrase ferredoxin [Streptomyces sp. CMB-StM0423]AUH40087.1 sucrase ferredoxin [Streptomyces sp. CMB-StM0423]
MSTCATASGELAEPLAGTAAVAATWLLVEQTGPWGNEALTQSHLDPEIGRALEESAEGTGVRVALIRRPGRHADVRRSADARRSAGARRSAAARRPAGRRVLAAHTAPGGTWIRATDVRDPADLVGLDFAALGRGEHAGFDAALGAGPYRGEPPVFVCTNGRRDRCCALLGRPLAADLHAAGATATWEITHIGGHRFSPTLLLLPHGYAYGRMTPHAVKEVVESLASGLVVPEGCRGRSTWERQGQAAELAVRRLAGAYGADDLSVVRTDVVRTDVVRTDVVRAEGGGGDGWLVTVAHRDGRAWDVPVAPRAAAVATPASCGAAPVAQTRMAAGPPRVH